MRTLTLIAAATAMAGAAAPAAAQYYPTPQPYPGQPAYGYNQGYGYPQQGGIAGIIGQLLGNRYGVNDRQAVTQCATAASVEASRQMGASYGAPYGNAYGYNQAYPGQARVTAITNVERRSNRSLRVTGLLDTGRYGYNQGYNGYGYNQAYAQGDVRFRCNVDYAGRVTNVRLNRVR